MFDISQYEKVHVIKESDIKSVFIVKHILTDELMIMKKIAGYHEIYQKLLDVKHENLQEVYGVFFDSDNTYLFSEYVLGVPLEDILIEKPLNYKEAKNYILQLCCAVSALHTNKHAFVHRDIKPSNIICSENFGLKLIDYDTVREHKSGNKGDTALLGTEGYAAPEQYGFAQTDEKTDIYAIGMVMLKMFAGADVENADSYNGKYKAIIKKCLQLDPNKRFKTVQELKKAFSTNRKCLITVFITLTFVLSGIFLFNIPYVEPYYTTGQISSYHLQGGWSTYEYVDDMISGFNYVFFMDNKVFNTFFLEDIPATIRFGRYLILEDLFVFEYVYLDPVSLAPLTWEIEKSEGFIDLSDNQEVLNLSFDGRTPDVVRPYFRDVIFPQETFIDIVNLLNELELFVDS